MKGLLSALIMLTAVAAASAAEPPEYINYEGVLRDANDNPLAGSHDMEFRFYDAETAGNLLLTDSHAAAGTGAVIVTGGLFNAHLGGGTLTAGDHGTLVKVFANESAVWLEIQIGLETLSPRVRVVAAGYALNASRLDGRDGSEFLDTSSTEQTKTGRLTVDVTSGNAIVARGEYAGGHFEDIDGTGEAWVAVAHLGIKGKGSTAGGRFLNTDGTGSARVATVDTGIEAEGNLAGAYFTDTDSSGAAYIAYGNRGIEASGSNAGGYFIDSDLTSYAFVAQGGKGIYATGTEWAGDFQGDVRITTDLLVQSDIQVDDTLRASKIHTGELTVEVDWAWPDYVLDGEYDLMPLDELDAYIEENGHLPGIPRADEVREHGISVGKSQAQLLQKLEELTLHLIAQNERLGELEFELEALRARDEQAAEERSR